MKKLAFLSLGFIALSQTADAQRAGFKLSPNGVEYKIVKDVAGDKHPNIGDIIEAHYVIRIGDSVMFDSRKMNAGNPIEMPLMENPNVAKKNDPTGVITMLTPGDSVVIYTELDSASRKQLVFPKPKDMVQYRFTLVSSKTKEQAEAAMKAKSAGQAQTDDKLLTDYFAKNKIKAVKTPSGLYYVITKPGTGANPAQGQEVKVNYTGKNLDGSVFDSNLDPAFSHVEPLKFKVGQRMVIAGWDEGLALLNKGAKATLYIPSTLAYGPQSPSPKIPANGILIFDVELLDFE